MHKPLLDKKCAVIGCHRDVVHRRRVCADPVHVSIEDLYKKRGQSRFALAERLERARKANAELQAAEEPVTSEDFDDSPEVDPEDEFILRGGRVVVSTTFLWRSYAG